MRREKRLGNLFMFLIITANETHYPIWSHRLYKSLFQGFVYHIHGATMTNSSVQYEPQVDDVFDNVSAEVPAVTVADTAADEPQQQQQEPVPSVVLQSDGAPLVGSPGPGSGEVGSRRMGTMLGVLIPVVLSQFSSLLFLRVGYLVGQAGLIGSLAQLVLAYTIILATVLSLCALCTNGAISGGGAYYMISRTLGPEFGGSVGILFLLANIFSSALYISGCVEGIVSNLGEGGMWDVGLSDGHWWRFLYGFCVNLLNLLVCLVGANMYSRAVLVILLAVSGCLASVLVSFARPAMQVPLPNNNDIMQNASHHVTALYSGFNSTTLHHNLWSGYSPDYTDPEHLQPNFFSVFAVLFSGVTGVMAGANMSGDLVNPARSIPWGTLPAQMVTFSTYVVLFLLTAATSPHFLLVNNYVYLLNINYWSGFVFIGIVMATVSASLSNLIGASRVLEALLKDRVLGDSQRIMSRLTWRQNPLGAVALCFIGVQMVLLVGSLNQIARFASIFFLLSYFSVNLACLGLEWASAPNFRPSFAYFTWHTCAVGILGTLAMSLLVSWWCMLLSVVLCAGMAVVIHNFSPATANNWGSLSQALIFHQVRKYLLILDPRKAHVKFWRPQMLLMVANPRSSCPLIQFVNDMKKSGLFVLAHVKLGSLDQRSRDPCIDETLLWMKLVDHLKVKAFTELTLASSVREGMRHLVRLCGMGGMKPNTVILGFRDQQHHTDFLRNRELDVLRMSDLQCPEDSAFHPEQLRSASPSYHQIAPQSGQVSSDEYVGMICDLLKMSQNICLCRHFHNFDKKNILLRLKNKEEVYVDAWPVNLFDTSCSWSADDVSSQFLLQLSTVILMTHALRGTSIRLRVFLCVSSELAAAAVTRLHDSLKSSLFSMRIRGEIIVRTMDELRDKVSGVVSSSDGFVKKLNLRIRDECANTAITYMYLPLPPSVESGDAETYLQRLTTLTDGLPPTVLVHGVSRVTTTAL